MKIAFISSEVFPYSKTGGLADVSGSLPKAIEKIGCEIKIFTPKYSSIDEDKYKIYYDWSVGEMLIRVNGHLRSAHLHRALYPDTNIEVYFIDCPHFFHRGQIYTNHHDEDERFTLLCKGAIEAMQMLNWAPDIIHCNDWQTGILPLLIKDNYRWDKFFEKTATVYTIHNMEYQGRFPHKALFTAEIDGKYFYPGGPVEHYGSVSFMKAGIKFSDIITTVSKTYAKEILTPAYGAGLEGVLAERKNDLYGILNGVDYYIWDPETDTHIPFNYSLNDLTGKKENKKFLMEKFKLPFDEKVPLIGIISRMAEQKGFDIFAAAVNDLMNLPAQWIVLGSGEDKYEDLFRDISHAYPDKICTYVGYNNELSHLIEAGADMFLMPSRYEPCGLNQIYSLKYGTVPVVRKTGGLADTVKDWHESEISGKEDGNGFTFSDYTKTALLSAVYRSVETFRDEDTWKKIQKNGMKENFSWETSAVEYLKIYKKAIEKRGKIS